MTVDVRIVAIVQARMGSSRFPGKMLATLGNISILEWVFQRLSRATYLDEIVLATSIDKENDVLENIANRCGVRVFRGSESDVLGRFISAADHAKATNIVRVCADNPFIDPIEVDRLVNFFKHNTCDYACNHQDRLGSGYADGFGAEIFTVESLKKIHKLASTLNYREHVTSFFWDHADNFQLRSVTAPSELNFPHLRFDVDTKEDLKKLDDLVMNGVHIGSRAVDIIKIKLEIDRTGELKLKNETISEINQYLQRLFPLCRSITGNSNRETLRILQEVIPLTIHEVQSRTPVYDWIVPDEWNIEDAYISDGTGKKIVNFKDNNLHVVSYSIPVKGSIGWEDLRLRLHRHPTLPDAIPYRTSYYKRDWGFCVTNSQYKTLEANGGPFKVVIDSTLKKGSLTYGELLLPGRSQQEILLSCYICHPSMANDSLSGVLLTAFLAREIAAWQDRRYSYRIIFVPETIGAITYCSLNQEAMKNIDVGLVITTVGGPGKFGYKKSFNPSHAINRIIERIFIELGTEFISYPFDIHGSDERQYSSQAFGINVATIARDKYYEYPEYHTSLDNLSFVSPEQIYSSLVIYRLVLDKLNSRRIYRSKNFYCEPMLSRHNLYPPTGGAQNPVYDDRSELDLILWVLFLSNGRKSIDDIALEISMPDHIVQDISDKLLKKGMLEIV